MKPSHPFDLVIGLDRSDRTADLHIIHTRDGKTLKQSISTSPESLHDWLAKLRQQHPRARVGICLEQPATNLILFLETYAWITLFPVNPVTVQNFRQTFVTSRAKDDGKDAQFAAQLLLAHHDKLKAWCPDDAPTRELQQLVAHRRAIVDERTALTNRLQGLLKQYFPQALALCGEDLWRPLATAFLLKWPTLQRVQKAGDTALERFYYLQGSRSQKLIQERLELIHDAVALTDEAAVLQSLTLRVQLICKQLQALGKVLAQFDQKIAQGFAAHPDRDIFASLPGAGPVLATRLLTSLGSERERYENPAQLQSYSGVAPVTKQSGGKCHVHRRYQCPKFHRQSFHEYAAESILWCRWAAAFYFLQRQRGKSHHTAVRALAFKWQRVIWKCWQTRRAYNDQIYEAALKQSGSEVAALLDKIELGKSPMKTLGKKS